MNIKKLFAKYPNNGYSDSRELVVFDKVYKDLRRLPDYIVRKIFAWARAVAVSGIREVRKVPGYHDEPLHGDRQGQRSIRLSRSYRAIYVEATDGRLTLIVIEEITKHEY